MNRLRPLAEGFYYATHSGPVLMVCRREPYSDWLCEWAPAECFADAKPEEPLVEERTLRSPDGSFAMKVWLKSDPLRIEAQIVQQPEEWRCPPKHPRTIVVSQGLELPALSSFAGLYLNDDCVFLRGASLNMDDYRASKAFDSPSARDAYLAKLEATVAAMPRLADQFKKDDRVVVAGKQCETAPPLAPAIGLHGRICWIGKNVANGGFCDICTDVGKILTAGLINLRHEREDGRPAEKEPDPVIGCKLLRADGGSLVGDDGRRLFYPVGEWVEDEEGVGVFIAFAGGLNAGGAGRNLAAFECTEETSKHVEGRISPWFWSTRLRVGEEGASRVLPEGVRTYRRVRRLPEIPMDRLHPDLRKEVEAWQAKHKPEPPPRKYEDGQWFRNPDGTLDVVDHGRWTLPIGKWAVWGRKRCWRYEEDLTPCPPPLSEAQRRLQPGDEVRVRKQRWDGEGKPVAVPSPKGIYKIVSSQLVGEVIRVFLEGNDCFGESLHNLDPAEEK